VSYVDIGLDAVTTEDRHASLHRAFRGFASGKSAGARELNDGKALGAFLAVILGRLLALAGGVMVVGGAIDHARGNEGGAKWMKRGAVTGAFGLGSSFIGTRYLLGADSLVVGASLAPALKSKMEGERT
jgi:hypothetical protein